MYGQPIEVKPTGFVDASFKDNKVDEWAESKRKKSQIKDQVSQTRAELQALSNQIEAEKRKRLEIEKELQSLQTY